MSKLETIPIGTEFNRQEYFDQLIEDNYQVYARRAEVSPNNKVKNPDGFTPRRCTCSACPQPFPWLSPSEVEERGGDQYPIRELGENFVMENFSNGEWISWGDIRSWQAWETPVTTTEYFYTTRCTPCDSKNRRVSRASQRIDDVNRAVGYTKFVTGTKPVIVLRTVPTNTEIQESMKEHGSLFRRRLSSRRVMLKEISGPSSFGYYWLECVVRAYEDDNFQLEVDIDDPAATVWTLHPHFHAVWSASRKKWNLPLLTKFWSPQDSKSWGGENNDWRIECVQYTPGQVADYVNKKSINQTLVEYVDKQATYWDKGFRTCNAFGTWSPSAKSRRRLVRNFTDDLFQGEKLTKRERKEFDHQVSLAYDCKGWLYKAVNERANRAFDRLLSARGSSP